MTVHQLEERGRQRKAAALTLALIREARTADEVARWSCDRWARFARRLDLRVPSTLTCAEAIEQLDRRARGRSAA